MGLRMQSKLGLANNSNVGKFMYNINLPLIFCAFVCLKAMPSKSDRQSKGQLGGYESGVEMYIGHRTSLYLRVQM